MFLMAARASTRCSFQLRAQIQTLVEVFVRKLGFLSKTGWTSHPEMAWTPRMVQLVARDHAAGQCKLILWNPAYRGFGRPDFCLALK